MASISDPSEISSANDDEYSTLNAIKVLGSELYDLSSNIHKYGQYDELGYKDAHDLMGIQDALMTRIQLLDEITRYFFEILLVQESEQGPKEEGPEIISAEITVKDSTEDILVNLHSTAEVDSALKANEEQRKLMEDERRRMKEKYLILLEQLRQANEEFDIAKETRNKLYEKTDAIKNAPVYECKIMVSTVNFENNDG